MDFGEDFLKRDRATGFPAADAGNQNRHQFDGFIEWKGRAVAFQHVDECNQLSSKSGVRVLQPKRNLAFCCIDVNAAKTTARIFDRRNAHLTPRAVLQVNDVRPVLVKGLRGYKARTENRVDRFEGMDAVSL